MAIDTETKPSTDNPGSSTQAPAGFNADDVKTKIGSLSPEQFIQEHIGANKLIYDLNHENQNKRKKFDTLEKTHNDLLKEVEDSKKEGLEKNQEFEKLYNAEKEKTIDFDKYKSFHDDQIEMMNSQVTELEGKLSTESKELYDVFRESESITAADKLKFLNKAIGTGQGISIDSAISKGGVSGKSADEMTMAEIQEHYVKTGVILRKTK